MSENGPPYTELKLVHQVIDEHREQLESKRCEAI